MDTKLILSFTEPLSVFKFYHLVRVGASCGRYPSIFLGVVFPSGEKGQLVEVVEILHQSVSEVSKHIRNAKWLHENILRRVARIPIAIVSWLEHLVVER